MINNTLKETTKIFHWKIESKGFFKKGNLNLHTDDRKVGTITNSSFKTPCEINGQRFIIKQDSSLINYPKRHQLVNADNDKVICEIQHFYSDNNKFLVVFPDKLIYDFTPGPNNPSQTNGQVVQSFSDKLWFADGGKLEIRTNKNIEALIVCFYFVRYIHDSSF